MKNKADFEAALASLVKFANPAIGVCGELGEYIDDVENEYNGWFKADIEELMSDLDSALGDVSEANSTIAELEEAIECLQAELEELR